MRFFDRGLIEVFRTNADVRDQLPTNADDQLRLVHEARAVRAWEAFREGIVWWMTTVSSPAVAGEFGIVQFIGGGIDQLWTLDGWASATSLELRLNEPFGGIGVVWNPFFQDRRWGPHNAPVNFTITQGTKAALTGQRMIIGMGSSPSSLGSNRDSLYISRVLESGATNDASCSLCSTIVNQTFLVTCWGKLIVGRRESSG